MKKRKIKLFASVASLAMVAAVMGVGVWAATTQAIGVTSSVSFTSTNIAATIDLAITGAEGSNGTIIGGNTTIAGEKVASKAALWTFTLDQASTTATPVEQVVAIDLADPNNDGIIAAGSTITYTFTINPTEGSQAIFYEVILGEDGEDFTVSCATLKNSTGIAYNAQGATGNTIEVVYTANANIPSSDADLADITIKLANTTFIAD